MSPISLPVHASYEQRTSNKTKRPYRVLVLSFNNGYQKLIFLDQAEQFMVESLVKSDSDKINVK
jgi:hypothetical protein